MKVFFVIRGWPNKEKPQLGVFERDQALALSELGHEIIILCVDIRFRTIFKKMGITRQIQDGLPIYQMTVHSLWFAKILKMSSILLYEKVVDFFFIHLYKKVVKKEGRPDLLYAHYLPFSAMALSAKRVDNVPVIGMEHWSELGYTCIKKQVKCWADYTYKNLDRLLSVSSALRENILNQLGVDSVVVNNMIGKEFTKTITINKQGEHNRVKFISIGNLIPIKGFDFLIESFQKARLSPEMWELNIVGEGNEHEKLQTMINNYGLHNNVHLLGRKERKLIPEILRQNDVFILSSYSETFGVAAIEALACGLPVIATECGGAKDYMTEKNGLTCPIGDVNKMSEAIIYMSKHLHEYDRKMIAKGCLSKFSSEAISLKLSQLFREVITNSI